MDNYVCREMRFSEYDASGYPAKVTLTEPETGAIEFEGTVNELADYLIGQKSSYIIGHEGG